jgi:hypothetical protein
MNVFWVCGETPVIDRSLYPTPVRKPPARLASSSLLFLLAFGVWSDAACDLFL